MGPTAKALKGCETQLKRIADGLEAFLAHAYDIHMAPHKPDTSGEEPTATYTDELADWEREYMEKMGQKAKEDVE